MELRRTPHSIVDLARQMRRSPTLSESELWTHLRDRRLSGAKFRRQAPLGRYIADFYCANANLVVELEGTIHDEEQQRQYDNIRNQIIQAMGIKVLHFRNKDVIENLEEVLAEIEMALSPHPWSLSLRERDQG